MKKAIFVLGLISYFFILFVSCNKEITTSPEITVNSPLHNQAFEYGDTIFVNAVVKDEIPVISVSVSLVNEDKTEVSPQQNQTFDQNEVTVSKEIPLNDNTLQSGQYYVHIIAKNESNTRSFFLPIQITGIQHQWNGLFVVTRPSFEQIGIMLLDTNGEVNPFVSLNGDYLSSEMNSSYQQLVVCGYKTGDLTSIDVENKEIEWSVPNQSSNDNPYFYSLLLTENRILSAIRNSEINSYDFSGTLAYSYSLPGQRYAEKLLTSTERLYAQTTDISGGTSRLIQFYTGSSLTITDHTIAMTIKSWFWVDGKLLVFANTGNTGRIYSYNYINNTFTLLNNTNSEIVNACQISITDYLVTCSDGIYHYKNTSANALNLVISQSGVKNLVFDSIQQRIFFHKSNTLYAYSYPDFQNVFESSSANEIVNIHLWYNR